MLFRSRTEECDQFIVGDMSMSPVVDREATFGECLSAVFAPVSLPGGSAAQVGTVIIEPLKM